MILEFKPRPMPIEEAIVYLLNNCGCKACLLELRDLEKNPKAFVDNFLMENDHVTSIS